MGRTPSNSSPPRMKGEDRRESILAAASQVFGERGYVGATTDAVAKAAGVSQPYVVRMFGTKEALFLEVLERSLDRLLDTFRVALDTAPLGEPREALHHRIGGAYVELFADRGLLLSLMHAFVLGADPVIGHAARAGFIQVYRYLRLEAGFSAEETSEFLANGMLINTLVGIRMADGYDTDAVVREMIDTTLPAKAGMLCGLLSRET
jgi:TetR/AcrR family transcriptional regulator